MIMMMSGIMGINPSLFEAAAIDGASSGQVLRKVTLPLLRPMVVYTLITSMIGGLQMFDIPYLYHTGAGKINANLRTVAVFVYEQFRAGAKVHQPDYGIAGAADWCVGLYIPADEATGGGPQSFAGDKRAVEGAERRIASDERSFAVCQPRTV